ncbi:MAG: hypothetical protein AAF485_00515 [Chloroflexota bacterium]
MSSTSKILFTILFILVIISIGLNIFLITRLLAVQEQARVVVRDFGPNVQESLTQTITDLETFEESTISFEIDVQQEIPVSAEIPFNERIDIPIDVTIPIKQEVETTIFMDPLQTGLDIPVDVKVPVDIEIPVDLTIPIEIERTIPIETSVPLDLTIPLMIEVAETEVVGYVEQLRGGLTSLNVWVGDVLAEVQ